MIFTLSGLIAEVVGCVFVMLGQDVSPAQLDVYCSVSNRRILAHGPIAEMTNHLVEAHLTV